MKEPIDEIFKSSLGGHEMPFKPDAWSAMKTKLDAVMPTTGGIESAVKDSLNGHEMSYTPDAWLAMKAKLDMVMPATGGVESAVKDSLNGHEMPYSPDAWNSMRNKLDVKMPTKPSSNIKYYIAAASIAMIGLVSYFVYDHSSNTSIAEDQIVQSNSDSSRKRNNEDQLVTPQSKQSINGIDNQIVTPSEKTNNQITDNNSKSNTPSVRYESVTEGDNSAQNSSNYTSSVSNNGQSSNGHSDNASNSGQHNSGSENVQSNDSNNQHSSSNADELAMKMPIISNVCLNEAVAVTNENDRNIFIVLPNGKQQPIKPGNSIQFKPSMAGTHKVGYYNNLDSWMETSSFSARELPEASFEIDRINKWNQGLPSTMVKTDAHAQSYTWKSGGQIYSGNEAEFHFFNKGTKTIELEVSNGVCKNTVEQKVQIDENYNLAAVNAFDPNSSNIKNNTFMPFALTERDVKFTMILIDPRDGGIVYETKDASQGWDGIDRRSGRQENTATTYIWKVTLENPVPGERGEYRGNVVKL